MTTAAEREGASLTRQRDDDIGLMMLHRARNKKSITLNLRRHPEGRELDAMGLAYGWLRSRRRAARGAAARWRDLS